MRLLFDWDPRKADINRRGHGVTFEEATSVFADRYSLTIFDDDHSDDEERWVTIGSTGKPGLLLVVHTEDRVDDDAVMIRIISARRATKREARQYRSRLQP